MTTSILSRSSGFTSGQGASGPVERARRVWEYRRILTLLVGRDLKVKYAGSALGYVWSVLEPLAMSVVFWYVFTKIVHRQIGYPPFILFLVSGQFAWFWLNGTINASIGALRGESQMVRSTNVPRELWIVRQVVSHGVEFIFSTPVIALFALIYRHGPTKDIVYLPLAFLLSVVFLTGVGLMLAPAAVLVADIRRVMRVVLRVLFYVSPVLYSVHDIPAGFRPFASWNPVAGILCLFRATFFPQELVWTYVIRSAILSVLCLVVGLFVFTRLERPMLKEI